MLQPPVNPLVTALMQSQSMAQPSPELSPEQMQALWKARIQKGWTFDGKMNNATL